MLRRLLLLLALAGVMLVPSSSFGAGQTSHVSGVITNVPGGINVALTNNGQAILQYIWVRMFMVRHTSCSADQGGACAPAPPGVEAADRTVRGYWANFGPGQTRNLTIKTDGPYPANGGADIFESQFFNSPLTPAGRATGPAAAGPCKCLRFEAKILPKTVALINPGDETGMLMEMTFAWEMACNTGSGKCVGEFDLLPPQPALKLKTRFQPVSGRIRCAGKCAAVNRGTAKMKLYGGKTLAFGSRGKKVKSMQITVRRECQGKKSVARVITVKFDRFGQIDKKNSDWNGDKKPG